MRIGILSDIHVDINYDAGGLDKVTPAVCDSILNNNIDVFITAGDISSDFELSLDVVRRIEKATGRGCLFVPGNHDLWNLHHPGASADYIYSQFLKHPHNLANGPVKLKKGWSAAGDTCWYDYSFVDTDAFPLETCMSGQHNSLLWPDTGKLFWEKGSSEIHDWFIHRLNRQLSCGGGDEIFAVSHMVPLKEFPESEIPEKEKFFRAFYGSESLGKLILGNPSIRYSVFGHLHRRKEVIKNDKKFICQALGSRRKWVDNDDPFTETAISMKVVEI